MYREHFQIQKFRSMVLHHRIVNAFLLQNVEIRPVLLTYRWFDVCCNVADNRSFYRLLDW
ncbi:hypothetical protein D3C73_1463530 [compost metagenome]